MTRFLTVFMASWFFLVAAMAQADSDTQTEQPYVFAWPFVQSDMSPRGGTTEGPSVQVVTATTDDFQRLQAADISQQERDRRAILAMAGSYRVSFDFMELIGYAPDFAPAKPYRSWGTEHVYVVENTPAKIVLQHILIMTIVGKDGEPMGPFVTKHWRQDWNYQDAAIHTYSGHGSWAKTSRDESARSLAPGRRLCGRWMIHRAMPPGANGSTRRSGPGGPVRKPGGRYRDASSRCAMTTT